MHWLHGVVFGLCLQTIDSHITETDKDSVYGLRADKWFQVNNQKGGSPLGTWTARNKTNKESRKLDYFIYKTFKNCFISYCDKNLLYSFFISKGIRSINYKITQLKKWLHCTILFSPAYSSKILFTNTSVFFLSNYGVFSSAIWI